MRKIEEKLNKIFGSFQGKLESILEMKLDENLIKNKGVFSKDKPEDNVTSEFSTTKGGQAGKKAGFEKQGASGEVFAKGERNDVKSKLANGGFGEKTEGDGKKCCQSEEPYAKKEQNDISAKLKEGYSSFSKEGKGNVQLTSFSKEGVKKSDKEGYDKEKSSKEEYAKGFEKAEETKEGEYTDKNMGNKEKPKFGDALKDKKTRFPRNTGTAKVVGKDIKTNTVDGKEADKKGVDFFRK
jgi:hypothetical protein